MNASPVKFGFQFTRMESAPGLLVPPALMGLMPQSSWEEGKLVRTTERLVPMQMEVSEQRGAGRFGFGGLSSHPYNVSEGRLVPQALNPLTTIFTGPV